MWTRHAQLSLISQSAKDTYGASGETINSRRLWVYEERNQRLRHPYGREMLVREMRGEFF